MRPWWFAIATAPPPAASYLQGQESEALSAFEDTAEPCPDRLTLGRVRDRI